MHIFLVNDDGITAVGIHALLDAAIARGHRVSMCAPATQQSAASHRFTLTDPVYVKPYPIEAEGCEGYAITGSPVDCVRLGLHHLVKEPVDVLISGINNGYNAGTAVHYSGTVGAAMEGALNYLPSIAVSIHHEADAEMLSHLAERTIEIAEGYYQKELPRCTILNINAPCVKPSELKPEAYAPMSTANFVDGYEERVSPRAGTYFWLLGGSLTEEPLEGTDEDMLRKGHPTLTLLGNPISLDKATWDALGL